VLYSRVLCTNIYTHIMHTYTYTSMHKHTFIREYEAACEAGPFDSLPQLEFKTRISVFRIQDSCLYAQTHIDNNGIISLFYIIIAPERIVCAMSPYPKSLRTSKIARSPLDILRTAKSQPISVLPAPTCSCGRLEPQVCTI